jgi:uncharacterized membrane protein YbaN (DUF454 family)
LNIVSGVGIATGIGMIGGVLPAMAGNSVVLRTTTCPDRSPPH